MLCADQTPWAPLGVEHELRPLPAELLVRACFPSHHFSLFKTRKRFFQTTLGLRNFL